MPTCTPEMKFLSVNWIKTVAGPTVWNSLPGELRDPACGFDSFKQFLKTILFSPTNVTSALEVFFKNDMRYINSRFTYLLTYLLKTGVALWQLIVVETCLNYLVFSLNIFFRLVKYLYKN